MAGTSATDPAHIATTAQQHARTLISSIVSWRARQPSPPTPDRASRIEADKWRSSAATLLTTWDRLRRHLAPDDPAWTLLDGASADVVRALDQIDQW